MSPRAPITADIARLLAAALLFLALGHRPYGFYVLLRWVVFAVWAYTALQAYERRARGFAWVAATSAILFNPVIPVHLGRAVWPVVDVIAGIMLVGAIPVLRLLASQEHAQRGG